MLSRISVKNLINAVLAAFMLLLLLLAGLGYVNGRQGLAMLHELDRVAVVQVDQVSRANLHYLRGVEQLSRLASGLRTTQDISVDERRALFESVRADYQQASTFLADYAAGKAAGEESALVEGVVQGMQPLLASLERQLAAMEREDYANYHALRFADRAPLATLQQALEAYLAYTDRLDEQLVSAYDQQYNRSMLLGAVLLGIALVILLVMRSALTLVLIRPLQTAVGNLQQLAKADLAQPISSALQNEVGQLFQAMREMQDNLGRIVGTVRESSYLILDGAEGIAHGNADLSSRTDQQAASLQETAASMEQLTSTVRQNADNARQASALANDASTTADHGRDVVRQVVETMVGITDSSQRIASIINVIDSIAFQTNILALNASVEAARAGEQGRGFAVVAGEVRNLASRSADAAREIKALIEDSGRRVEDGSQLVEQAGRTMADVVSAVRRVTDIIDEISAASQEQSDGIAQVNVAVAQMDRVTQQNAGLVQEATVASSTLAEQAQRLEQAVAAFRIAGEQRHTGSDKRSRVQPARAPGGSAPARREPAQPAAQASDDWQEF
nr:methyl-accepting chemotaxis protein [Pseudomonas sp. NW5]